MTLRLLFPAALALMLWPIPAWPQSVHGQPRQASNLLVCSWNIKWFRDTGKDLTRLAQVIAHFDLCGIIELQSDRVLQDPATYSKHGQADGAKNDPECVANAEKDLTGFCACGKLRWTEGAAMKFHGARFGESFIGQKVVDVPINGDPRKWPILWTSPLSLSPTTAVARAKAECDLSENFLAARWISSGSLVGWLIETDGTHLFWSGKNREGFRLRREPSLTG